MNKSKKIFIITITFLMLVGLTTITATDTNTNDTTTITQTTQTNTINTPTATDTTQASTIKNDATSTTSEASTSQTDNLQETTNTQETINNKSGKKTGNLKADSMETITTFNQLRNNLTSNKFETVTINIDNDIQLAGSITVNSAIKNLTINGNNKTIDGKNQYRFLYMHYPINVRINDLIITHCNFTGSGGVIYGNINSNNSNKI